MTHSGDKPYKCPICHKEFSWSSELNQHYRIHSGDKPYICTICNKAFSQAGTLNQHKRTHSGEKPYKCTICNNAFSHLSNLNQHKMTHSDDKPYKCTICNKAFSLSSYLNVHRRTHSGDKPYKCTICNKAFSQKGQLNGHKKTHSDDKPYKCTICFKEFSRLDYLYKHKRTHSGDKPYKCNMCDKVFSMSSHLNKHSEKIHDTVMTLSQSNELAQFKKTGNTHNENLMIQSEWCSSKQMTTNRSPPSSIEQGYFKKEIYSCVEHDAKPECKTCGHLFKCEFMLNNHLEFHSKMDQEFKMSPSERAFAYSCGSCCKSFQSWIKVFNHFSVHSSEEFIS